MPDAPKPDDKNGGKLEGDTDGDGQGDACDTDDDGDGVPDLAVGAPGSNGGDGALWFGTGHGLTRYQDGRFRVFTSRDGLLNDTITGIGELG